MLVPMKKAALYALQDDREQLLFALQKTGEFMPEPGEDDSGLPGRAEKEQGFQRVGVALKFVAAHQKKKKLFEPRLAVPFEDFCRADAEARELTKRAEDLSEAVAGLKSEVAGLGTQLEQLKPWQEMPERLDSLRHTACAAVFAGFLPEDRLADSQERLANYGGAFMAYGQGEDGRAVLAICHKAEEAAVLCALRENGFAEAKLPQADCPARELSARLGGQIKVKAGQMEELDANIQELAERKDSLKKLYDKEKADFDRLAVKGNETADTFCLTGWLRSDRQQEVESAVASVTGAYELVFSDPEEGDAVPSVTDNSQLVAPYEAITNLYSRPSYNGIDPNPMLAPFYFLFFGIMLGDAGYGLVLTLILFFVCRLVRGEDMAGKLSRVILMGSVSTVFWGALFGGWFGLELTPLLFVPMSEPIKMLAMCYCLGAIHLASGVCIKMYMEMRRGNVFGAFVDHFSWLAMLGGLALYALLPEFVLGGRLALAGMLIILFFAGREHKNIVKRLLGGVASLYNITSFVSDILSYSRLFALGLATGVIGMVINTIAGMLWDVGVVGQVAALVLLLGGHTFNIAVNVLGAYVHASRLQFLEFFGKFYEPGGHEFKPLAFRAKYVDILK